MKPSRLCHHPDSISYMHRPGPVFLKMRKRIGPVFKISFFIVSRIGILYFSQPPCMIVNFLYKRTEIFIQLL